MATITIRATSPSSSSPDPGNPSSLNVRITNAGQAGVPDGSYDAWCLNPFIGLNLRTDQSATFYEGSVRDGYAAIGQDAISDTTIKQLNWIVAQNFTSDPKYGGRFNYGEVQAAIWELLGHTDYLNANGAINFLTMGGGLIFRPSDVAEIKRLATESIQPGGAEIPSSYFTAVIDVDGVQQPIIIQLPSARLGDYVWEDLDRDGVQDADEAGVNGVTVNLLDAAGNKIASTITGDDPSTAGVQNGFYEFTGLKAGDYRVEFVKPGEFGSFTTANADSNGQDTRDSDADANGRSQLVTLKYGDVNHTVDAGLVRANSALGDRVWLDKDGDGTQDSGEAGLAGVRVILCDAAGNPTSRTATTDSLGNYLFDNLTPGVYSVKFEAPAGYIFTQANAGNDIDDSDANVSTGKSGNYLLNSGDSNLTVDAGLVQRAHLGDRVWEDTDADGRQDDGEQGIANVRVHLKDADGNIIDTTSTDANGIYGFEVLPGTYSIQIEKPAGYIVSPKDVGADDGDSDIDAATLNTQQVTLNSGDSNLTLDAGLYRNAQLGDRVWLDKDGDGTQDSDDNGVSGVRVILCDAAGNPTGRTATTDSLGNYLFDNLAPGVYSVRFEAPVGYEFTRADVGGDATDSDAINLTSKTGNYILNSGDSNLTVDAGLVQRARLGDRVWEDTDADGRQDNGEQGIANVRVHLKDANGNVIASTSTDGNGIYGFNVLPGTYSVQIEKPAGYIVSPKDVGADDADSDIDATTLNTQQVTLNSGDANLTLDAGLYRNAQLGDRVWLDKDGDGIQESGEAGLAGVRVILCDAAGNPTGRTALTNSLGNYIFDNLTPGTYSVKFELPTGYEFTRADVGDDAADSDANSVTGKTGNYTLASGHSNLTVDAGLVQRARLGDRVWEDTDADGRQDNGEQGIANVRVHLKDANGNIIASTSTDANGIYGFNVLPGTYSVQIEKPAGYIVSPKDVGADDADSDIDAATLNTQQVTLNSGDANLTLDAGLYRNAQLGDRVWLDKDGDGIQDSGEAGLASVRVILCDAAGNATGRTALTNSLGNYIFDNLTPGTYSVKFELPAGYEFTRADVGGDAADSDANSITGKTGNYILNSGDSNLTVDAGLVQRARLGDRVWEDTDANGRQDNGELGIANVRVHLKDANGTIIASTSTDANGIYGFNVLPGTYSVQIEKPAGYVVSPKDVGTDDADSDIDATALTTQSVTLASGDSNLTLDAGLHRSAAIGDRVWHDRNANGIQDANESGMANVTVHLRNAAGVIIATQSTDINGNYLFTGLRPGTYSLQFEKPDDFVYTLRNTGQDDTDSDASRTSGITEATVLTSGETDLTWDAGLFQRARLGDRVWEDLDADGIQDEGEAGIAGVTLQLQDDNGAVINTTTTNADGYYYFNVRPGTYSVSVVPPAGLFLTRPDAGADDARDSDMAYVTRRSAEVTLESGEENLTIDAGLFRKAALGDRVWLDTDGDGQQDADELGAAGVQVLLCDAAGNPTGRSAVTDASGNYLFDNLTPGTYSVKFQLPTGYVFTRANTGSDSGDSDADTVTGKTANYTLVSGQQNLTVDAGILRPARLGDRVWEDRDADGQQDDGEQGIANVRVHLRNATGQIIASTSTDANGLYGFEVMPGTYSVQIEKPAGYVVSPRDIGADDRDSDIDATTLATQQVTLKAGDNNPTLDAGLYRKAELGDRVWLDSDGDGQLDLDESGFAGVRVLLCDAAGNPTGRTAITDSQGNYLFGDLTPGTYSVKFEAPAGYGFTQSNTGNDSSDSDAIQQTGKTGNYTLQSGESNRTVDAGLVATARLGDRIWEDRDADGYQDDGEQGIANVRVHLRDANGQIIASTSTDGNGIYGFTVAPGTYSVQIEKPTGYYLSPKNIGADDARDSDIDAVTLASHNVTLRSGDVNLTLDGGLYRKASIGDRVWEDMDHDYVQDAREPGVGNVKVNLQNSLGQTLKTTYTDSEGYYHFVDLDPGVYRLQFDKSATIYKGTDMSTWRWAKADIGSDDSIDADAYSTNDVATTVTTTLESGENDMTWDAGVTPLIIDLNGDGVHTIARTASDATFDLLGTGTAIRSGWVSAEDGLLAVDANGNGQIDSIHELFGGLSKGDGFAKLGQYDSNGDGWVDSQDAAFDTLRVWQDADGDRHTDGGELRTLAEAGIAALKASYVENPFIDAQGNLHLEQSSARLADGSTVDMTDVYFNVSRADVVNAGVEVASLSSLMGDDRSLDELVGTSGSQLESQKMTLPHAAPCCEPEVLSGLLRQLEDSNQGA